MGAGNYTHTTRAVGLTLTANIYNTDHTNHITNHNFDTLDDYSSNNAEMQTVTDPYPSGSESLATSGAGELERIRYVLKQLGGGAQWYVDPVGNASRIGFNCKWASTTTITVEAGSVSVDGTLVSKATDTTLDLTVSGDWVDDDATDQATDTRGYIYINASGKIEMDDVAPDESDTSGNTSGLLRYNDTGTDTTDRRILGSFYMNGTGSGELASSAVWSFNEGVGGWEIISVIDAVGLASVDFDGVFTSTYSTYMLIMEDATPANNTESMNFRLSEDGGSTWLAGTSYAWACDGATTAASASTGSASDSMMQSARPGLGTPADESISGTYYIHDPLNALTNTRIHGTSMMKNSSAVYEVSTMGGVRKADEAHDSFQIISSAGNIASGVFKIYGLR